MIEENQLPKRFGDVIEAEKQTYNEGTFVQIRSKIPDTSEIPIENPKHWLKIPDVICVFVDMKGSTKLSANTHDRSTACAYQLFTGTAVRLLNEFNPPYIDVKGDGVFALFNKSQPYTALAAVVTFKTFAQETFTPMIKGKTGIEIGTHLGIDQKTILVKKIGLKRHGGRTDRQNEVWAGKPVNMASKLASLSENKECLVSDRYFKNLVDGHALKTCGCPDGNHVNLWSKKDLSNDNRFDFNLAYRLGSIWCKTHGNEYCEALLSLD